MKNIPLLTILMTTLLLSFSCRRQETICHELYLREDVKDIVNNYIKEHPQFNTFLIKSTQGLMANENIDVQNGFLLGPGYEFLIEEYNPTLYFDILDSRVFHLSSIDELIKKDKNKWIIKNEVDSVVLTNGWIIKDSRELFILRSIYFYYDETENLQVNLRPDTIFAPILSEDSIQFENIQKNI